jgi:peptide/nickel transport system substrate-binding protein
MDSYWQKVLSRRIGRRRAIAATAGAAGAGAFLAACGGGNGNGGSGSTGGGGGSSGSTSGLITSPGDTTSQAKAGGGFVFPAQADPGHLDGQAQGQVQLNVYNSFVYEALVRNKMGHMEPSSNTDVEGQLAQSWEVSGDGTQITFKIRDGVKWQNKAPLNGRPFTAEDVVQSWDRYVSLPSNNRATNANSINPTAPVVSVTSPDAKTVVVKLKEPTSYMLQRYTSMVTGEIGSIYPREADGGFDPKKDQIGTGGYILDKWEPSVAISYRKNPDYWDKQAAYYDTIQYPVVPEYATQLAQFKSGGLSTMAVQALDQVPTKKDVPALAMYPYLATGSNPLFQMRFGWLPIGDKKSPFLDVRVRQALSMAVDRDSFIDQYANVSKFKDQGIDLKTYYSTAQGYLPDLTIDPRDKSAFGDNAKYFEYNVSEAKKLIDAAKSAYGGDFPAIDSHAVNAVFGPTYIQGTQIYDQFARDIGFTINSVPIDYVKEYLPNFVTKQGQFSGILYGIGAVTSPHIIDFYVWKYYSKSGETSGALGFGGPDGSLGDKSGDPQVDTLIEKGKATLDSKALAQIDADLQKYLAKQQYAVSHAGWADSFILAWPAISNFDVWWNDSRTVQLGIPSLYTTWFDSSKPSKS